MTRSPAVPVDGRRILWLFEGDPGGSGDVWGRRGRGGTGVADGHPERHGLAHYGLEALHVGFGQQVGIGVQDPYRPFDQKRDSARDAYASGVRRRAIVAKRLNKASAIPMMTVGLRISALGNQFAEPEQASALAG